MNISKQDNTEALTVLGPRDAVRALLHHAHDVAETQMKGR